MLATPSTPRASDASRGGDAPLVEAEVVVLGAGLCGLSTAYHLGEGGCGAVVLEQATRVGGSASSEQREGFTFDVTGHWLHLRDPRVRALVERLLPPEQRVEHTRRASIYTHGGYVPYPFQANVHALPGPIREACLTGFVRAQIEAARAGTQVVPRRFEDFARQRFGDAIAEHFFVPYNRKLWGAAFDDLTPEWVSRYVPIPSVEEVVAGALGRTQDDLGYNTSFLYPRSGGIGTLSEALWRAAATTGHVELRLGHVVHSVDPDTHEVMCALDGGATYARFRYDRLVSTLPLPDLVTRLSAVPTHVRAAAKRLRSVPWRYLNVAVRGAIGRDDHWIYVPDPSFSFFRVGVYTNAAPAMAPPGCAGLYVELTDRSGPPDLAAVVRGLTTMGLVHHASDIDFIDVRHIERAYVVFDDVYEEARGTVLSWLEGRGISSRGRYGGWVYNSMQDCIAEGLETASSMLASRPSSSLLHAPPASGLP